MEKTRKTEQTTEQSNKKDGKSTAKKVWWTLGIILLLILITWILLLVRASMFASPERNSIFLVPANPGLTVNDDKQVWGTESCIDLFEEHYYGDRRDITVESSNGDKVIAPGTESEYTFSLKNTGNVAMDYSVSIDAGIVINSGELLLKELPIGIRLRKYSGEYLLGDGKTWVSVANLEDYLAEGTLAVNNYAWYTLEWKWLYEEYMLDENGELVGPVGDEWDTFLGNLSTETPISLQVNITTNATPSTDFEAIGGIEQMFDGDESPIHTSKIGGRLRLWPLLLIIALIILIVIVSVMIYRNRKDDEEDDGEDDNADGEGTASMKNENENIKAEEYSK